mgnify:CR=1 FL=1
MRTPNISAGLVLLGVLIAAAVFPARAQDFYRGKTITMIVAYAAGGGTDLTGRLVAPYLTKYLPGNPAIVVQNVPGAGSLTLTNQLYNTAPRDGTVLGAITNGMPTAPILSLQSSARPTHSAWISSV